jgi:hypothetical protein
MTDTIKISRELASDAALMLEAHSPGSGSLESYTAQDIRAALAQPSEPQGGEEVEVVAWMWRDINGDVTFNYMHPEGQELMTVAQHRRLMAEQLERERGVVEALRFIAGADPLVVTPKYRIAASEALAAWEKNHGK